jgi:hypothetical protein
MSGEPATPPASQRLVPIARNVLFATSLPLRSASAIEVKLQFSATPTGDADRDRKSGILSIVWHDKDGVEIPMEQKPWSYSERFGRFQYLELPPGARLISSRINLKVPAGATSVGVCVFHFSNYTMDLVSANILPSR